TRWPRDWSSDVCSSDLEKWDSFCSRLQHASYFCKSREFGGSRAEIRGVLEPRAEGVPFLRGSDYRPHHRRRVWARGKMRTREKAVDGVRFEAVDSKRV